MDPDPTPDRSPGQDDPDGDMARAGRILRSAERVTVLTGAGISTDSGIPDFRGPEGLWTKDPDAERLSNLGSYLAERRIRVKAWQGRLRLAEASYAPNAGHEALVALERQGRLRALVTQNIDGLHQAAGSTSSLVHEVHGSVAQVHCVDCHRRAPMAEALERVRAGDDDPACPDCGGIQKSTTVLFGEQLDAGVLEASFVAAADTDVLLAVGTSLAVTPISHMVPTAWRAGVPVVIVNAERTEYDDLAAAVVRGSIAEVLPTLVGA